MRLRGLAGLLLAIATAADAAALEAARPFGDGMVLQRDLPAPVWGTAEPGERIRVRFRDQSRETVAGPDGSWRVTLDALKAGGPERLRIDGSRALVFEDVLVGEVWLGAGQSNMAMRVKGASEDQQLLALLPRRSLPGIRLLRSGVGQSWQRAGRSSVWRFSAELFAFGLHLQRHLGVPVGLILAAVSETESLRWLPEPAAGSSSVVARALADGRAEVPVGDLFASHVRPLVPYALRGILWDQGENGSGIDGVWMATYYAMRALVGGWRSAWKRDDLVFLYFQKPSGGGCAFDPGDPLHAAARPFGPLPEDPSDAIEGFARTGWIGLRELPWTAMVTTSDLGSGLHPTDKASYAARAARVARGFVYGSGEEIYGPAYASHEIVGDVVRVRFAHAQSGLVARHSERLQGFALAGEDGVFHWAEARIEGDRVAVRADAVPEPALLRYAWAFERPWANLFNADGLPATTFEARLR